MTPTLDPLLAALVDLAIRAGREILAVAATDFAVEIKADASPVTAADARAEAVILAGLATLLPGVAIVAEEESAAGRRPADLGRRFLLVDPLDGTREFVNRSGEYTVNIALVEDGRPVLGVVHAPALGEVHAGRVGEGAAHGRLEADGTVAWTPIAVRPAPTTGLAVLASRSHCGAETEALLARLPVTERVAAGSSLKFCRLAEGVADLYPRLGRTMEWDTAAGDAVLRAAGGHVVTLDGRPLAYGKRRRAEDVDFANPWFLALGDDALIAAIVDKIQR
jgi:3'(2'), 5'-bisphosphate nucleotidase